jgi:hypothetical protein
LTALYSGKGEGVITHWLITNWHWLIIVGILLSILGPTYMGYGFLNLRFLQGLTQGFTYGLVGGIIGGLPIAIILSFLLLLAIILLLFEEIFLPGIFASAHVGESALASLSFAITGGVFGLVIGFLTGIVSIRLEEFNKFSRIFSWWNILLLFLLGVLCILLYMTYLVFNNQSDSLILLIVSLYGFVLGILFARVQFSWIKWANGLISAFVAIVVLLKLAYLPVNLNSIMVDSLILVAVLIFCMLTGYVFFNQPQFRDPHLNRGSWIKFALWLVVGWICGFILLFLSHLLLKDVTDLIIPASAIGILIAFGNGEGKKLLNEPRPKLKNNEQGGTYPVFSWPRFRRGFSIAFLYAFLSSSLLYYNYVFFVTLVYNELASIFKQIPDLYPSLDFYIKLAVFLVSLVFGLIGGCITAIIYAEGNVILFKVERLSENEENKKRFGLIGLVFTILGIVLIALPSLIS